MGTPSQRIIIIIHTRTHSSPKFFDQSTRMISNMSTLSLAVLLLVGHCALARESRVLRRLVNKMGYNDDTTTHHRLPRHLGSDDDDSPAQVKDRSFTVEYRRAFGTPLLKCTVDGFKSALLGKYTLTDGPPTGKKTVLTNDYKATISLCDWVNQDHSDHWLNGDWVICDKMGLIHFWAPVSTNNALFPPTTGWNYAAYQEDERAFEGWDGKTNAPSKCQIV